MKITYKIIVAIFILISIFAHNVIYASMADYTDEQADNKQKQEQQEWQKEQEERINKSSNNFLKSVTIKKYDLTPEFDKQTVNYKVEKEVTDNYLEISAEADDEKSSVSGTGKIKLQSGENNLRIDVTAENGTVRTYFINVNCVAKDVEKEEAEEVQENNDIAEPVEDRITQIQSEDAEKHENSNNIKIIVGLVGAVIVIVILIIIFIKNRTGKKRHGKRKH